MGYIIAGAAHIRSGNHMATTRIGFVALAGGSVQAKSPPALIGRSPVSFGGCVADIALRVRRRSQKKLFGKVAPQRPGTQPFASAPRGIIVST